VTAGDLGMEPKIQVAEMPLVLQRLELRKHLDDGAIGQLMLPLFSPGFNTTLPLIDRTTTLILRLL
jgi:hypothetical protein